MSLDGGSPKTLCPVPGVGLERLVGPRGTILFAEWGAQRLMRVPEGGGTPAVVRSGKAAPAWPQFLPDGRRFLFNEIDLTSGAIPAFVGSLDSADVTASSASRASPRAWSTPTGGWSSGGTAAC